MPWNSNFWNNSMVIENKPDHSTGLDFFIFEQNFLIFITVIERRKKTWSRKPQFWFLIVAAMQPKWITKIWTKRDNTHKLWLINYDSSIFFKYFDIKFLKSSKNINFSKKWLICVKSDVQKRYFKDPKFLQSLHANVHFGRHNFSLFE